MFIWAMLLCSPHSDLDDGRQRYLDLLDDGTRNEDEHEAAQLKRWEKKLLQTETKEQRDYKEEFFELLNEVSFYKTMLPRGLENWFWLHYPG